MQPVLEHARQLLRAVGLPLTGNHELVADCIVSLSSSKGFTFEQAREEMERAVRRAREQQIPIDRFFFQDGRYWEIRPGQGIDTGATAAAAAACRTCGDEGLLLQRPEISGLRLIPCPDCEKGLEQAQRLRKHYSAIQLRASCSALLQEPESECVAP